MEVTQEQTVESPQTASTSEEPLDMSVKSTQEFSASYIWYYMLLHIIFRQYMILYSERYG